MNTLAAIALVVLLCALLVGVGILAWPRRPKPDLIDLERYEADLLDDRDRGGTLRPVVPIPQRMAREWTCDELETMRRNRRVAAEIYRRINQNGGAA